MKRFAIEIVRGNDTRLFGTYDTKEQGYEVGKSYAQALAGEGGVIVLFRGEFDEKNNRLTNESRIYEIYDGAKMRQISAQDVLDIALAGTSATLLARRWESALLVNVDNGTLQRLLDNPEALEALMSIEGFRSLNSDIETIINKSDKVKKAKKEKDELSKKEKKELSDEEKEYKSLRKQIQEKLIKFATRIPVFMYLTDYRESCLKDVITQLEPGLFKKVTGLNVKDFELLCSLGVFNSSLMSDAIFKFKRYEDSSLTYTGIDKHEGKDVGGWDTVLKREEYEQLFYNQQATMEAPKFDQPEMIQLPKEAPKAVKKKVVVVAKPKQEPEIKSIPKSAVKVAVNPRPTRIEVKKPDFDMSSVKLGAEVSHKIFGTGKIIVIDTNNMQIRVQFDVGEKSFLLPDAFTGGFIELK